MISEDHVTLKMSNDAVNTVYTSVLNSNNISDFIQYF